MNRDDPLSTHWLLGRLPAAERVGLVKHSRVSAYPANATIFRRGDPGSSLLAVLRGRVLVSVPHWDGRAIALTVIRPGEVLGEIALLDGAPRTADARAVESTEVLIIERRDLMPLLKRSPDACVELLIVLCGRLRQTNEQVEDLMFLDKTAKVSKRLVSLARSHGRPTEGGITIDLKLSQRDLGSFVGLTRESVNRQLGTWRDAGLLTFDDGYVTIPDLDAFESLTAEKV